MALKEFLSQFPKDKQHAIAIILIKLALPIWNQFADKNKLTYRDTVVGLYHEINHNLLTNGLEACEDYLNSNQVDNIFSERREKITLCFNEIHEPVVALQDYDLELPHEVVSTLYAVYNLICSLLGKEKTVFDEPIIYVSINQAIDALTSSKILTNNQINEILLQTA